MRASHGEDARHVRIMRNCYLLTKEQLRKNMSNCRAPRYSGVALEPLLGVPVSENCALLAAPHCPMSVSKLLSCDSLQVTVGQSAL